MARSRLSLIRLSAGAARRSRAWLSPIAGVLPSPLSARGRLKLLTGLWVTAFLSQRYSNSDDSTASRCRTVAPPSMRPVRSSRQAITWARVTVRNSSGRFMPVKNMKSSIAALYARRVLALVMLANHSISGGTSASFWNSAAVRSRFGRIWAGSWSFMSTILFLIKSEVVRAPSNEATARRPSTEL
jgi:hypothetical protein